MPGADWAAVPMPAGIAALPRDERGYPITFVTLVDSDGRPDFTALNSAAIEEVISRALCGLCGQPWPGPYRSDDDHQVAFIGGPRSCESGLFVDPPMHVPCAEYAMQVCPHLATPTARYSKTVGEGRLVNPHVSTERPDRIGLYITEGRVKVAILDGHVVFGADEPREVRWTQQSKPE